MRLFLLAFLFCGFGAQAADVTVYTEDAPPLNYVKNGKPDGVAVAIVQEIMKRVGNTKPITIVPWARGYDAVQAEKNVALFSTTRTEQRESLFKWVGPLASKEWVFVAKAGKGIKISSLEDAKKVKSIGAYKDDAKEQYLTSEGFKNLDRVSNDSFNAKKLVGDRIDLWLTGKTDLKGYIASEKLNEKDFEIVYTVKTYSLSVAFSKSTDDAIVKKWQDAYDSMVKDGSLEKIKAQYAFEN